MKKNTKKCLISFFLSVFVLTSVFVTISLTNKNTKQDENIELLNQYEGMYDTNSIVLENTNKETATKIATRLNATLRMNFQENYATLTLPENVSVKDIYLDKNNKDIIDNFSLNMYAKTSSLENEMDDSEDSIVHKPTRPEYYYQINDTDYEKQTYLDYLNMKQTWNSYKGDNITVAIIDTGIDTDHDEFDGKISEYSYNASEDKIVKDYLTQDGTYDYSLIEDKYGHGTAVAGVIAASFDGNGIVGIAPNVNLLIIKVECDDKGNFLRTSDLVFGLYYAIERNVDVINMSFGGKKIHMQQLQN